MRKIITAAVMAATLFGTLGMASSASAQEWGPRHGWEARYGDGWHRDGYRDGYRDGGYWQARRDWHWRHEQERRSWDMRHDDRCRWDRCW
jgi:Spy/CpxP family protein refolding chaperone